jgi:hypothetical protein
MKEEKLIFFPGKSLLVDLFLFTCNLLLTAELSFVYLENKRFRVFMENKLDFNFSLRVVLFFIKIGVLAD